MQKTVSPALEARGLTRRYAGRTVVDDVSFQVMPGRVTGFLGPNGAGKQTDLLKVLQEGRQAAHPTPAKVVVCGG